MIYLAKQFMVKEILFRLHCHFSIIDLAAVMCSSGSRNAIEYFGNQSSMSQKFVTILYSI